MITDMIRSMFQKSHADLDAREAKAFKEQHPEAQWLDVRGIDEAAAAGTITGSAIAPLGSAALAAASQKFDVNKPLVVFCRSGARSRMACAMLAKQGFKQLHNLTGGYTAYKSHHG
jgi:sulfur-carrier protein adenylyltransferase/sulfurtransferase